LRARFGLGGLDDFYDLVADFGIEIIPFTQDDVKSALSGFEKYGKGLSPIGRLNLGDCAAYALAKNLNAPLLFKGNDFAATDVEKVF
jgi:ribonuclease VapC